MKQLYDILYLSISFFKDVILTSFTFTFFIDASSNVLTCSKLSLLSLICFFSSSILGVTFLMFSSIIFSKSRILNTFLFILTLDVFSSPSSDRYHSELLLASISAADSKI
jgi:hypothetical protein